MNRILSLAAAFCSLLILLPSARAQSLDERTEILRTREAVWRAWFANDTVALHKLVPAETIVFSGGETDWKHQKDVFREAAEFQAGGGKLIRLEFPRTEMQRFGDVAIVWSDYVLETETKGKRSVTNGRASEIFVRRDGLWVNPGWHTNSTKNPSANR